MGVDIHKDGHMCEACHGSGLDSVSCSKCIGKGLIKETKTILVDFPAGLYTGHFLRLAKKGNESLSGIAGDLLI
jgi:molecular chaperone DnaJ